MITDLELLQHRHYSDWKRDDGCMKGPYCIFCNTYNGQPLREWHRASCERLTYLKYFYNVTPKQTATNKLVINGVEFTRSDIFGWWTNNEEFSVLIKAAFEKEEKSKCLNQT